MRIHLLGIPNTVTADVDTCPFTAKVFKLGRMLTDEDHHVIHYGCEKSALTCAEHVTVTTEHDIKMTYGDHDILRDGPPLLGPSDRVYDTFLHNTINAIFERKQPGDLLLATFGSWHKPVALAHPELICIESGIGYPGGVFAENRIFESYAIMHATQTVVAAEKPNNDFWYDAVIPIAFDPNKFEFSPNKDDFLLFMGRMHKGKGLHVAIDIARRTKTKLYVAGYGALDDGIQIKNSTYVEFVGSAHGAMKRRLLKNAKAVLTPSHYLEPFNAVQIEAMFSGTPVISTDWGAFAEYNAHGVTGFRCKSMEQFVYAVNHSHEIDPHACRKWAERFALYEIAPHYTDYFRTVKECYGGDGWFAKRPDRTSLRGASFSAFF